MNRRRFFSDCGISGLFAGVASWWPEQPSSVAAAPQSVLSVPDVGQPVDLGRFGEWKSWISPEASEKVRDWRRKIPSETLNVTGLPWKSAEIDLGVEWAEYRTIHQVIIRYPSEAKSPRPDRQSLEYWNGLSPLQGSWEPLEHWLDQSAQLAIDRSTWAYTFVPPWLIFKLGPMRTCKLRIRLQEPRQVEVADFIVQGQAHWKTGEIFIEWGYTGSRRPHDGLLEAYNAEILEIRPWKNAEMRTPLSWSSKAGDKLIGGIAVKLLYTTRQDADRSALTLRTEAGSFSFLPAEALGEQPIDVADFGFYVRGAGSKLDRAAYRLQNAGKVRIEEAVARHSEQDIETAYARLRPPRTRLTYLAVDANNHKFGVRPDGNVVVGFGDPSNGKVIRTPSFAVHFATCDVSGKAVTNLGPDLFADSNPKSRTPREQRLDSGWLPILTTKWASDAFSFERRDYARLLDQPEPLVESRLLGTEPAVLVSQLKVQNNSTAAKEACLLIRPWKPQGQTMAEWDRPLPVELANGFRTGLSGSFVTATDGVQAYAMCLVETHGRGSLTLLPSCNAVACHLHLGAGEEHRIQIVIPGWLVLSAECHRLEGLRFDDGYSANVRYWVDRVAQGVQVQVPDPHVQNLCNASLEHFLIALTKDPARGEYYANTAMLTYGAIGSESNPIIQAFDMRGYHELAEKCLQSWLSTQGWFACDGDAPSKEGAFCRFWPAYTVDQGFVLWALAEHYFYTGDAGWLRRAAPQIVAGCDYLIRERKRAMILPPDGTRPVTYGLAPAGCVADMRDWHSSFMLNGYYYLGLKRCAQALRDVDAGNADRIAREAQDYRGAIRSVLKETIAKSPATRLRDNTSVPSVPPFPELRGYRWELRDAPDVGYGNGAVYDVELGALHLLKCEVLEPDSQEVSWMLSALEDRFFMTQAGIPQLQNVEADWFDLGGFARSQPYYLHYQEAYLRRDDIPNFLRGFFNTVATSADPYTLTFAEGAFGGGTTHKTHEEAWFFHQLRFMLVLEMGDDVYLARGTPRRWLEDGKAITVRRAPSYYGELGYQIRSFARQGRIEATVQPPPRLREGFIYLRFRHPQASLIQRVQVDGNSWKDFDPAKEWIRLPGDVGQLDITAYF